MKIFHEFKNNLLERFRLQENDAIIVGVSGGSDSAALLHLMYEVSEKFPLRIVVAHVNYHTRGKDSDADELLVASFAKKLHLAIETTNAKVAKGNFEEKAREFRYSFFEKLRKKYHAKYVAVAHTQDDQAETILMHILKGAGLEGLSGMQPQEGNIIRPTLSFTKQQLRGYLRGYKIPFREDATNKQNTFTRNKIRNVLIPDLTTYNKNFSETLVRNAEIFSELNTFLKLEAARSFSDIATTTRDTITFQTKAFETLPRPVARELFHQALRTLGHVEPLSAKHFEQVYKVMTSGVSNKSKEITKDLKVTRFRDVIRLHRYR